MANMDLIDEIIKIVGAKSVLISNADKAYASLDKSTNIKASLPLMVVKVKTAQELINVARTCFRQKVPVVVKGAGTGKSAGALGDKCSVVIDILGLNQISIDTKDLVAEVEPGVILNTLKEEAKKVGLFYPPDPASFAECSIGGNVAENASGPSTLKYGTTRDYLLGGQVLLSSGELIDFGKRCPKGVTGYDVASLLCGSEGTLGIFTKFILRLLPMPKSFASAECFFADEELALKAVTGLLSRGHRPNTIEFIDEDCLKALFKALGQKLPAKYKAALIIECDSSFVDGAALELQDIFQVLKDYSLVASDIALDEGARKAIWQRRSMLSEACSSYFGQKISEDVSVPLGKLFEFCKKAKALDFKNLTLAFFGHAGDGNLHVQIMFIDKKHLDEAERLRHEILLLVLKLQGTLSAEHGIGLKKKSYMPLEQSQALIDLQKRIKHAFDPENLLNPGKIFD